MSDSILPPSAAGCQFDDPPIVPLLPPIPRVGTGRDQLLKVKCWLAMPRFDRRFYPDETWGVVCEEVHAFDWEGTDDE